MFVVHTDAGAFWLNSELRLCYKAVICDDILAARSIRAGGDSGMIAQEILRVKDVFFVGERVNLNEECVNNASTREGTAGKEAN